MGRGQSILNEYREKKYNEGRQQVLDWLAEEHPEIAAQYVSSQFPTQKETKVILGVVKLYDEGVPESYALPIIMRILGKETKSEKESVTYKVHLHDMINDLRDSGYLHSFEDMKCENKGYWLKITPLGEKYLNEYNGDLET